jgi:UDP-2,3-diacylglucosamine hydrolase
MEGDPGGGDQTSVLRVVDGVPEVDPAGGDFPDPAAHPQQVVIASRLPVTNRNFAHRETQSGGLELAIAETGLPQVLAASDVEPDQMTGVVRDAHLVDFRVVHPHLNRTDALARGLPAHRALGNFPPVLGDTLVVLSDAHLGYAPPAVETALLEFLDIMPSLGDALLLNGDLFEFWFAYRTVVPRHAFPTAAALCVLARKVPILMVGGNHDRWGVEFWNRDVGIRYAPYRLEFAAGGRRALALHGDGLGSSRRLTRIMERLVGSRAASLIYQSLHPEVGFPLVHRLSAKLGEHGLQGPSVDAAAARQRSWAEQQLREHPAVELLVLGHTHRAALVEAAPGRHYLNPGAWFDDFRYAVVAKDRVELRQFTPSVPLPPGSSGPR